MNSFYKFLNNLGFCEKEIESYINDENIFIYYSYPQAPKIKYIFIDDESKILDYQLALWNQNEDNTFIAVTKYKTHIVDLKKKPITSLDSQPIYIKTFNYGVNTQGYQDVDIQIISKDSIDSMYFFEFIQKNQRTKQEVDKDLLLNLISLRNDLLDYSNEEVIHLLILRCLFVKYLEDRGIFSINYLSNILNSKSPDKLLEAFSEVRKINGDVFGNSTLDINDIKDCYLEKLYRFFTTDYRSGQGTLFPYQFDNIPIQLISHVYEALLKNDTKQDKGVYYTPSFIVDYILSLSLKENALNNPYLTILDPAVGSGSFLVESFKILRDAQAKKLNKQKLNYDEKKLILEKQLWGIDIDKEALQITAFSLYLALLEDETSEFIKTKIEQSSPILPSLINKTLIEGNTIKDSIFDDEKFDFIVSNPPWGAIPEDNKEENILERKAIDNKDNNFPEYSHIASYERSQAFLRRVERWQNQTTIVVMIVKNSIFLNDKAKDFRYDFLNKNRIQAFYELSHYNKILFKKKVIGKITQNGKEEEISIGASEPCAIVIYRLNSENLNYKFEYVSPKLTKLGEHFEVIHYTDKDKFIVSRKQLVENDILWKILVNGDIETFRLIEKIKNKKSKHLKIASGRGFEPKKNGELPGEPVYKDLLDIDCFESLIINGTKKFNWNQIFRNKRDSIFETSSVVLARRPLKRDGMRLRAVAIPNNIVFKDNIIFAKMTLAEKEVPDYSFYEALLNSSLIGFYLFNISSQWGKGDEKWAALRTKDIEDLPLCDTNNNTDIEKQLFYLLAKRHELNRDELLQRIDKQIYDLYDLTEYEKEIVNEFYAVNVKRSNSNLQYVREKDIKEYFDTFKKIFNLILSESYFINASYNISPNIGAIIKISINNENVKNEIYQDDTLNVLNFVKKRQLYETDKLFKEEKVKLYDSQNFYLIKSNLFKDWTKRQASIDAKEEIDLILSNLPDRNE